MANQTKILYTNEFKDTLRIEDGKLCARNADGELVVEEGINNLLQEALNSSKGDWIFHNLPNIKWRSKN